MLDRFAQIAQQPNLYQAVDYIRAGHRRSVYGTDSIYYRINGCIVEIMAILGYLDTEDWLIGVKQAIVSPAAILICGKSGAGRSGYTNPKNACDLVSLCGHLALLKEGVLE